VLKPDSDKTYTNMGKKPIGRISNNRLRYCWSYWHYT